MVKFNKNLNNLFTNYQQQQTYAKYEKASSKDKKNYNLWKDIDVNKDKKINSKDKSKIETNKKSLLKNDKLFDVNGDGKLTQNDIDMFVKGDVNGDGKVTKEELNFVSAYKKELTTAFTKSKADFIIDGKKYVKGKLANGVVGEIFYKNGVPSAGTVNSKVITKASNCDISTVTNYDKNGKPSSTQIKVQSKNYDYMLPQLEGLDPAKITKVSLNQDKSFTVIADGKEYRFERTEVNGKTVSHKAYNGSVDNKTFKNGMLASVTSEVVATASNLNDSAVTNDIRTVTNYDADGKPSSTQIKVQSKNYDYMLPQLEGLDPAKITKVSINEDKSFTVIADGKEYRFERTEVNGKTVSHKAFTGKAGDVEFKDGMLLNGEVNGKMYVDGVLFNGIKDGMLYENGLSIRKIGASGEKGSVEYAVKILSRARSADVYGKYYYLKYGVSGEYRMSINNYQIKTDNEGRITELLNMDESGKSYNISYDAEGKVIINSYFANNPNAETEKYIYENEVITQIIKTEKVAGGSVVTTVDFENPNDYYSPKTSETKTFEPATINNGVAKEVTTFFNSNSPIQTVKYDKDGKIVGRDVHNMSLAMVNDCNVNSIEYFSIYTGKILENYSEDMLSVEKDAQGRITSLTVKEQNSNSTDLNVLNSTKFDITYTNDKGGYEITETKTYTHNIPEGKTENDYASELIKSDVATWYSVDTRSDIMGEKRTVEKSDGSKEVMNFSISSTLQIDDITNYDKNNIKTQYTQYYGGSRGLVVLKEQYDEQGHVTKYQEFSSDKENSMWAEMEFSNFRENGHSVFSDATCKILDLNGDVVYTINFEGNNPNQNHRLSRLYVGSHYDFESDYDMWVSAVKQYREATDDEGWNNHVYEYDSESYTTIYFDNDKKEGMKLLIKDLTDITFKENGNVEVTYKDGTVKKYDKDGNLIPEKMSAESVLQYWNKVVGSTYMTDIVTDENDGSLKSFSLNGRHYDVSYDEDGTVHINMPKPDNGNSSYDYWENILYSNGEFVSIHYAYKEGHIYAKQHCKYDSDGKMTLHENTWYTYHSNGKLKYLETNSENYFDKTAYDEQGNVIYTVESHGYTLGLSYPRDGSAKIRLKNGETISTQVGDHVLINEDGSLEITSKDGTVKKYDKDGNEITE